MQYRQLGNTGLWVSEIGLGGEWLERHGAEEVKAVVDACREQGINIIDCFMSEPNVRSNIGNAIRDDRDKWIIQGHIGSAWRDGQYVRTRDLPEVKAAFADLLERFHTDYMDLGMIHFVDRLDDWQTVVEGGMMDYVQELKATGAIRHIGLSTQPIDAGFNTTSFPSKVLMYMSNGLRVVSVRIPAIETSSVGDRIYYYDNQDPKEIARVIRSVALDDGYDSRAHLNVLHGDFVEGLKRLLNG